MIGTIAISFVFVMFILLVSMIFIKIEKSFEEREREQLAKFDQARTERSKQQQALKDPPRNATMTLRDLDLVHPTGEHP